MNQFGSPKFRVIPQPEDAVDAPDRNLAEAGIRQLAQALPSPHPLGPPQKLSTRRLSVWFGPHRVLEDLDFEIPANCVTSIIGPSGCGKSTLLRSLNRMNEMFDGARVDGQVLLDGNNIYERNVDVGKLRKRVGMVFQESVPFPKSVFENVAFGPRVAGIRDRYALQEIVHRALEKAVLWDEVRNRLDESALRLSGGQQQRLCIARCLATDPEVLLMDEPASALDPAATSRIEDLIFELKSTYTIVIVTHNMQQAARVSDQTAFIDQGRLIEVGPTTEVFTCPREPRTEDYLRGRFG